MTRTLLILIAAVGSAALLAGALTFQYFGYPPCELCYWQRYPHYAAVVIGVLAILVPSRLFPALGALAAFATAAVGLYHTGVERKWWAGPSSCTGSGNTLDGLSGSDLLVVDGPRLIMCDKVSWELIGISMASWNMIFSILLLGFWLQALRKS